MAWKKNEPAILYVPLENKAAIEAAKKDGVYKDVALGLAGVIREIGFSAFASRMPFVPERAWMTSTAGRGWFARALRALRPPSGRGDMY